VEREANYAAVGAFVLAVLVLAGLFVYWYSDARDHRSYTRYEIYFDGSVSGLSRGSPVRYLGVDVGRVNNMNIDPRDSSRVQVIADIDSNAPVSIKTVAELSLQGVTGVLFIDLIQNNGSRRLVPAVPSLKYPVIRSVRSNFDVLLSSLPDLVGLASGVVERVSLLLSDQNLTKIATTVDNIEKASNTLPQTVKELNALLADLRSTTVEIKATTASIRNISDGAGPEVKVAMERLRAVADNLANATSRLDLLITDNRRDLRAFTRDGLPEFENLMREGRAAASEIRELSRSLKQNPSQLLYEPADKGVEIPR
jgi:phospholipid/cholesterol/gamma-HCH transport system substrate-binding protein